VSVKATNWVWECSQSVGNDRLVLLCIADRANDEGLDAFPSIANLARRTKLHERTVQRCLRNIEALGELDVRLGEGPRGSNLYVMRLDSFALPIPRQLARGDKSPGVANRHPGDVATGGVAKRPPGGWRRGHPNVLVRPGTSKDETAAHAPRPILDRRAKATAAQSPNGNGNYRVIERVAVGLLVEGGFAPHDDAEFAESVKQRCAELHIDYGRDPEVARDVVARACASARIKASLGRRLAGGA